jgi:hypothetical protein
MEELLAQKDDALSALEAETKRLDKELKVRMNLLQGISNVAKQSSSGRIFDKDDDGSGEEEEEEEEQKEENGRRCLKADDEADAAPLFSSAKRKAPLPNGEDELSIYSLV